MSTKPKSILYTPYFVKKFQKLPTKIQTLAIQKETLFKRNMFHPTLKTHKLQGKLDQHAAFSINHQYRVLFAIEAGGTIVFIDVDIHQIYR